MKRFVIFLLLAVWLSAAVSAETSKLIRFEETLDAMGTGITVVAYGDDRFRLQSAVDAALEEAKRLEEMLSNYRPQSEWSQMNRSAGGRPFQVSPELFDLLATCKRYSEASEGAFDISVGPLMKVWGFYKGTGRFPHRAEIRNALGPVGFGNVELDARDRTVRFRRAGVELDPGGIGKGYAVDRMADILKKAGIRSALITAGSSSIYAIGFPEGESRGWHVSIRHPKDASKVVQEVYLKDESMSTSGNYEKFFRAEGKIWSHIMDPRTGYPAQGMYSVSVITPRCLDSEAWTKPYYINGRQWASGHKLSNSRVYLCEDKSGDNRSEPSCAWLQ
ncbi:MAG: FAD:protein FMN transferase [Bryobacteraceae bacterium]|nr:FAD:protein FMN transferase [Bryobacteraceae bacterium]